jgi:hypothetical protein
MSPIISRAGFSFGFGRRRGGGAIQSIKPLNISPSVSGKSIWDLGVDGKLTLNTGTDYTVTVDSPITVDFKIWGAGGGGGSSGGGGGGGSATGTMNLLNGTSYIISIGSGGYKTTDYVATSSQGGGGGIGPGSYLAGTGGGYSGIFRTSKTQGNAVVIAGGGGGGGYNGAGGAGGYPSGSNGGGPSGGGGGTPTAGGAGGAGGGGTGQSGSALTGGYSVSVSLGAPGGGGGGGYYGGGGGGSSQADTGGGGGGGSNYQNPTYLTSVTQYSGSGTTAGNSSDPDRGSSGSGQPFPGSSGSPYAVPGSIVLS